MTYVKKIMLIAVAALLAFLPMRPVDGYDTLVPLMRDGQEVKHFWSTEPVMIPDTYDEKDTEFRGVWVATVYNLNMPQHTSESQYKSAFNALIDELLESNMNAMLFQVRPLNDAFYASEHAPFSRYLTGVEGQDPGWDVLGWMIDQAHAHGIEFHAWMNPYRVANTTSTKTDYLATLAEDNFAKQRPDLVVSGIEDSHGRHPLILNPGEPEVKQYIRDVVTEIVTDYDVDGVHFDDYFYPYSGIDADTSTYDAYKTPGQSIDDWRRENVNDVVRGIKEDLDAHNATATTKVRFGISPFGLWGSGIEGYTQYLEGGSNTGPTNLSSYRSQFADSKKWVEEGWLHYICPQVYFPFTHTTAPYADVVDWWAQISRGTGVDVYIGHALSGASSGNWVTDEIFDQLRYNQKHPEIKGEVMYSADFLDDTHMAYVEDHAWTVTPLNVRESTDAEIAVTVDGPMEGNLYIDDVTITLEATESIWYKIDNGSWTSYTAPFTISGSGSHVLYMKTMDGEGVESETISENIPIQYINNDVPAISVSGTRDGDAYLIGSEVTITSDEHDIYVAVNHGFIDEFELYTGPIVLDEEGRYYVRAYTVDERDTMSEEVNLGIDVVPACYGDPVIDVSGAGQDPHYQTATITLSGETTIEYKINDGAWTTYEGPFTLASEGDHTIYYRNDDVCGTEFEKTITIDQTPPTAPGLTIDGPYDGERYYTGDTTLTLNATEADSTVMYRLHNGATWTPWQEFTDPIELLYSGTYTLEYKAVDEAGNESAPEYDLIRLDIPPSETTPYVVRDGQVVTYYDSDDMIALPEYTEKTEEIRAVWVATVANIDIGLHENEAAYKQDIITMLDTLEAHHFNTMFFQVRPMNDAFYDSDYAPWSRYLTGTEGEDPGWDVLSFIIEESHKRGIEFHAWLNPYRVSSDTADKATQLAGLHEDNFARQHPDLVIADSAGKLILNPGEPQVQAYIVNVIRELMATYDVDGIHFDDYFYSYSGTPESADASLYERLADPGQTLADWRRDNINTVMRDINDAVQTYNADHGDHVKFGVSPFGIWASGGEEGSNTSPYTMQSYHDQYADTKKWVEEGWVDYIMPQLYWAFDHSSAPFADLADWWAALCGENNVDLIIGHGLYRYIDAWDDVNEVPEQLRYIAQYDSVIGSTFFSYNTLLSQDTQVTAFIERLNQYYWTEYVTFPWESDVEKQEEPTCPVGEEYIDGECVSICPIGEEYIDGDCVSICPIGEEYIDGDCVPICGDDEYYEDGECHLNPCPTGEERIDGDCVPIEPDEPEQTGCGFFNAASLVFSGLLMSLTFLIFRRGWR